jgi:hypothetical protein
MTRLKITYAVQVLLSLAVLLSIAGSAQQPRKAMPPLQAPIQVGSPDPKGADPRPEDAGRSLLAAFDRYEIVGMSAAHDNKDLDEFVLHLIRNSAFPQKVSVIAVECGNALYQQTLDRYIDGDDVPLREVRKVWRNTTQIMCGLSGFYEQFFPLVRRINESLPSGKKIRVLACDTPIDWSGIKTPSDYGRGQYLRGRDASIASIMEKEVLGKHRKALMLFGLAHLYHVGATGVELYEKEYPNVTLIVADHTGFGNLSPVEQYNNKLEARMVNWPIPSLVPDIHGTWLAALLDATHSTGNIFFGVPESGGKIPVGPAPERGTFSGTPEEADAPFSKMVDAYLYLAPRDLLLNEPTPAEIVLDKEYMAELQRRVTITGAGPMGDEADPAKIAVRDTNPFFYDPDELRALPMMLPDAPSAQPGKPR